MEAKLPTIRTDGKAQPGRSSEMETVRREKIRDGEDKKGRQSVSREKLQVREKVGKSRNSKHCVFPMFCGPGGSKK